MSHNISGHYDHLKQTNSCNVFRRLLNFLDPYAELQYQRDILNPKDPLDKATTKKESIVDEAGAESALEGWWW